MEYKAGLKSVEEFIGLFEKVYPKISEKENKSTSEDAILGAFLEINPYIHIHENCRPIRRVSVLGCFLGIRW